MPKTFRVVMAVLSNAALINSTKTGLMVMMMEACSGLVAAKPLKKNSWLMVTPVSPQSHSRPKSERSTLSQRKAYRIQNKGVAPATLNAMKPEGPTFSGINPLATR